MGNRRIQQTTIIWVNLIFLYSRMSKLIGRCKQILSNLLHVNTKCILINNHNNNNTAINFPKLMKSSSIHLLHHLNSNQRPANSNLLMVINWIDKFLRSESCNFLPVQQRGVKNRRWKRWRGAAVNISFWRGTQPQL